MDVSPAAMVQAVVANQQADVAQKVQLAMLRKSMDMEGSAALALLQGVTGALPLANSGSLGTQVNVLA
ncbi:MAG: putative motility protein [Hydrogenophaga sp.]|uniref:putative motility protein n=1 Tax=Hydrogenophaga sp. TaxID=1904254 RepID=UPI0016AE2867|nr:putative motility protein [Hydrogenophaga sp.]NIM42943.1 putative motility protein [Hydrogenophaga sp.]NIN27873.1 putative motility protein [Hydrogenophaga sp.]NIN29554.1 putative motility protein [Hydrogenophaga sp.]NIN57146.1 putative motility protein [Hydrogenophaga sp.]NIO53557.1 putative motility protein [Hydrogenophaga sp.]